MPPSAPPRAGRRRARQAPRRSPCSSSARAADRVRSRRRPPSRRFAARTPPARGVGLPSRKSLPAATTTNAPRDTAYCDRLLHHRRRRSGAADAHVEHLGAVVRGIPDTARHHIVGAHERAAEDGVPDARDDLHRHDADVERHARDSDVVVRELADGPRDVRAMAVEVERVGVVPDEVARRDEPIRRRRGRVPRQTARQSCRAPESSFRRYENARALKRNTPLRNATPLSRTATMMVRCRARIDVPCPLHVDRRIVPLPRIQRIVRRERRRDTIAGLRVVHVGLRLEAARRRFRIGGRVDGDDVEVRRRWAPGCAEPLTLASMARCAAADVPARNFTMMLPRTNGSGSSWFALVLGSRGGSLSRSPRSIPGEERSATSARNTGTGACAAAATPNTPASRNAAARARVEKIIGTFFFVSLPRAGLLPPPSGAGHRRETPTYMH